MAWTTVAAMQLILLGLLTLVRIGFGPGPFLPSFSAKPLLFDNVLVIYLGLILLLLGSLHARVWFRESPFTHGDKK